MLKLAIKLLVTITALTSLSLGAMAAFSSQPIKFHNPQVGGSGAAGSVPGPPLLAPPENEIRYEQQPAHQAVTKPDQRPVAQLIASPDEANETIEAFFPSLQSIPENVVAYTILSSIRYHGKGNHTILVTTAQPSKKATQEYVVYGEETLDLGNGRIGWKSSTGHSNMPNQIVFLEGDLIITIASDLPISTLKKLVPSIQVN
jgi:hypothetical protein